MSTTSKYCAAIICGLLVGFVIPKSSGAEQLVDGKRFAFKFAERSAVPDELCSGGETPPFRMNFAAITPAATPSRAALALSVFGDSSRLRGVRSPEVRYAVTGPTGIVREGSLTAPSETGPIDPTIRDVPFEVPVEDGHGIYRVHVRMADSEGAEHATDIAFEYDSRGMRLASAAEWYSAVGGMEHVR